MWGGGRGCGEGERGKAEEGGVGREMVHSFLLDLKDMNTVALWETRPGERLGCDMQHKAGETTEA